MVSVLLVEDNETDIFVIRKALEKCAFATTLEVFRNGEAAVDHIRTLAADGNRPCPTLLLLDLNVPRVPGIEVLRELRNATRCSDTWVIVVTSSDSRGDRDSVQKLGANAYFRKPSDLHAYLGLSGVIDNVLSGAPDASGSVQ